MMNASLIRRTVSGGGPPPGGGAEPARAVQPLAEFEHLLALPQLRGNLAAGQHGMQEEQQEDCCHRRLRDVVILEHRREPFEAALACQDGPDQDHVPPHEKCQQQSAAPAYEFVS